MTKRRAHQLRTRGRTAATAVAATAVAALVTGCGGGTAGSQQGTPNASAEPCGVADSLVFATGAAPATLDPGTIDQSASTFIQPAYEPLIRRDQDGQYVPALATEWGYVGEGNTAFQLTLREGVTFPDGGELTAQGVVDHFTYLQQAGGTAAAQLAGWTFTVDGPTQLTIQLASPNPIMDELLSQDWVIGMVVSPVALQDPSGLGTATAGAGEYVLDPARTVAGDTYVYTANPDYWDPSAIHYDELTIRVISNPNSLLSAMQTGEVDAGIGDFTTASAARGAGLQVAAQPTVWQGLGLFDRSGSIAAPLADQRVRQAINYAIDREAVTTALYAGDGVPTSEIALPGSDDYNEDTADLYAYDPDKARQLLAAAGYPDGFALDVLSTDFASIGTAGQAVAGQLEQVGITVNLVQEEVNSYITDLFSASYPAAAVGLGSPPVHISATLAVAPTGPFNPFRTEDAELEQLYTQAAAASPEERTALNQRIVARVQELAWFAPVTFTPVYYYGSTTTGGLVVGEQNRLLDPVDLFSTEC